AELPEHILSRRAVFAQHLRPAPRSGIRAMAERLGCPCMRWFPGTMRSLRDFTPARVDLGRTGHSLPTAELLNFQFAHARARDAVHLPLDTNSLAVELQQKRLPAIVLASAAPDRATYLRRPDLGR